MGQVFKKKVIGETGVVAHDCIYHVQEAEDSKS